MKAMQLNTINPKALVRHFTWVFLHTCTTRNHSSPKLEKTLFLCTYVSIYSNLVQKDAWKMSVAFHTSSLKT